MEPTKLIEISPDSKKDLKAFIGLPWKLHSDHKDWVPPIFRDEYNYFNPRKNHALKYCDIKMFLFISRGRILGRIMGIINHRYNEATGTNFGRFTMLDCIDDHEVCQHLLNAVEDWIFSVGMKRLVGPMGIYYHDPMGLMIEGFEYSPAIATHVNFPYLPKLVSKAGYEVDENLVVYKIDLTKPIPDFYTRIYERSLNKGTIQISSFRKKAELRRAIVPVLTLMNSCFEEIYGYTQLDNQEMNNEARKFIMILDPQLVKVAYINDELVGFIIGMPNLSEGLRASNGRLLPIGFYEILKSARSSTQLDLLIGGILNKYRGIGIDVLLGYNMIETAKAKGFKILDSHLELEKNVKMRAEMFKLGGEIYKRYRLYRKNLK